MLLIDNRGITDPRLNLALEEYALLNVDISHDHLLFYINKPSIIIGRYQNTIEEINADYVRDNGIHVVRRISGGGAVYHDLGNLNFSFITRYKRANFSNYAKFTAPVVEVLESLGIDAGAEGRNDISVGGRKISGNAQYVSAGRMFSHGTLLFDSKLDDVVKALDVKAEKIVSKGIKSVRSRVANISEFLREPMSVVDFRRLLLDSIFGAGKPIPEARFSPDQWREIEALAESKYSAWDWNYGASPPFNIQKTRRFPAGRIDMRLQVESGIIQSVKIYGDFFARADVSALEAVLIGVRFDVDTVAATLRDADVPRFFEGLSTDDLIELLA